MVDLQAYLNTHKDSVDEALDRLLPAPEGPAKTVAEAMRYAVMAGGKRLRPVLAIAACEACGGRPEAVNERPVRVEAESIEDLIVDWLNEVIAMGSAHGELYRSVTVSSADERSAEGVLMGEPVDRDRHKLRFEVEYDEVILKEN